MKKCNTCHENKLENQFAKKYQKCRTCCKRDWKSTNEKRKIRKQQLVKSYEKTGYEKTCRLCSEKRSFEFFGFRAGSKDGLKSECKLCEKLMMRLHFIANHDKWLAYSKMNFKRRQEEIREKRRKRYKKYGYEYTEARKKWEAKRRENPVFRLSANVSRGIHHSLKDGKQKGYRHWEELVGYTIQELKEHLESLFQTGMSWENYGKGGWHIDHIIPKCSFKIEKCEDESFKKCWALSNLQPLWEFDNLSKGSKRLNDSN